MTPGVIILEALANLLANDPATLAQAANANLVHLAASPFTPGPALDPASITEASFTGAAAKAVGLNAQQEFIDPATGLRTVQLIEPVGGWHWLCTVTPAPAQTIYGWYVTDQAGTVLFGSELFSSPRIINAAGQALDIGYIRFTFPSTTIF